MKRDKPWPGDESRLCGLSPECEGCQTECCEVPCSLAYRELVDYSDLELADLADQLCEQIWRMNERRHVQERLIANWDKRQYVVC
jgi:hypothetical protein